MDNLKVAIIEAVKAGSVYPENIKEFVNINSDKISFYTHYEIEDGISELILSNQVEYYAGIIFLIE